MWLERCMNTSKRIEVDSGEERVRFDILRAACAESSFVVAYQAAAVSITVGDPG